MCGGHHPILCCPSRIDQKFCELWWRMRGRGEGEDEWVGRRENRTRRGCIIYLEPWLIRGRSSSSLQLRMVSIFNVIHGRWERKFEISFPYYHCKKSVILLRGWLHGCPSPTVREYCICKHSLSSESGTVIVLAVRRRRAMEPNYSPKVISPSILSNTNLRIGHLSAWRSQAEGQKKKSFSQQQSHL